jgi:hypothetical protein
MEKDQSLTIDDLLTVGMNQVAYIRTINTDDKSAPEFSVHAADGTQLSIMDSYDMALAAVKMSDLYPVTLH